MTSTVTMTNMCTNQVPASISATSGKPTTSRSTTPFSWISNVGSSSPTRTEAQAVDNIHYLFRESPLVKTVINSHLFAREDFKEIPTVSENPDADL